METSDVMCQEDGSPGPAKEGGTIVEQNDKGVSERESVF